jgi:hypothetical protein
MSRYRVIQKGIEERRLTLVGLIEWIVGLLAKDDFIGITIERHHPGPNVTITRVKG